MGLTHQSGGFNPPRWWVKPTNVVGLTHQIRKLVGLTHQKKNLFHCKYFLNKYITTRNAKNDKINIILEVCEDLKSKSLILKEIDQKQNENWWVKPTTKVRTLMTAPDIGRVL